MTFEIEHSFPFEAGHVLIHHNGKCSSPHGHSYVVKVKIVASELIDSGPQKNMVLDFYTISSIVGEMIELFLDHKWLNDSLGTDSPSAEFIAHWIFKYLEPKLKGLHSITLFETPTTSATYKK